MDTKKNVKANTETKATTKKTAGSTAKATTASTAAKKPAKKGLDMTKPTLASVVLNLRTLLPEVVKVDDALASQIDKALKSKKSTVESLSELLSKAIALGNKPVVENDAKPKAKKTLKKPEEAPAPAPAKKPTKAAKSEDKKPKETKKPVKSEKTTGDIKAPIATIFPDTITTKIDDTEITMTKAAKTDFTKVEDVVNAMNEGKIVVFACYWTARHIKEYTYSNCYKVACPKSFKDDLDLALAVVDCPKAKRLWAMSIETEAMYFFEEDDLVPVDDKNPYNGETYSIRVSNGMEFEIYVADAPEED